MSTTTRRRSLLARVAAVVTSLGLVAGLTACGSSQPRSVLGDIQSGEVVIGTKYDQPGLGLREPDKAMSGVDVDVATYIVNTIADNNGWEHPEIVWREAPSAQREMLIRNGEMTMIVATYSINQGRANAVNFGGPYLLTHQALLVRDDDNSLNTLADLDGRKLCSVTGSTPAQTIKSALPSVQLQEFDSYTTCVEALRRGKVDAMTTDATILAGYAAQYNGEFRVVDMVQEDGTSFTDEFYGVGHTLGDDESTEAINEAVDQMVDSGEFARIMEDNLGEYGETVEVVPAGDLSFLEGR